MNALIHPFTSLKSSAASKKITAANRYVLTLEDGSEMLDAICGMWHVNFGYSSTVITEKMTRQLHVLPASSLISSNFEVAEEVADKLRSYLGRPKDRILLTNSGAEAVEATRHIVDTIAQREGMARARIGCLPGAFHGNTGRAREISHRDSKSARSVIFTDGEGRPGVPDAPPWAIFYEPVQGVAGGRMLSDTTVLALKEYQKAGSLLIADEVGCGMGRTGVPLASSLLEIEPDVVLVSKGLTGGYAPLGAVLVGERTQTMLGSSAITYGHTAAGSPLACAAALAVLDMHRSPDMRKTLSATGQQLGVHLRKTAEDLRCNYRHYGLLGALELDVETPLDLPSRLGMSRAFQRQGLLLRVAPGDGKSIPIVPGFDFSAGEFEAVFARIRAAFAQAKSESIFPDLKAS